MVRSVVNGQLSRCSQRVHAHDFAARLRGRQSHVLAASVNNVGDRCQPSGSAISYCKVAERLRECPNCERSSSVIKDSQAMLKGERLIRPEQLAAVRNGVPSLRGTMSLT
jgi:hypothetical protein